MGAKISSFRMGISGRARTWGRANEAAHQVLPAIEKFPSRIEDQAIREIAAFKRKLDSALCVANS